MQTLASRGSIVRPAVEAQDELLKSLTPQDRLEAVYRQLFKENRNLEFFRNPKIESKYLSGDITTRELVLALLQSEMYRDYIMMVNSNYRFVALTFERVLGRDATADEQRTWASLLATVGLNGFAKALTSCDEYIEAYGDDEVPTRRSEELFSSRQCLPALPQEASEKRYQGDGTGYVNLGPDISLWKWEGSKPPKQLRKVGAVFAVAGTIEVARIVLTVVASIFGINF
ncbi:MAG: phycobilisome rod-core linker polypeptide [Cyanobacteria bacterium P01_D01_bin.105]